MRWPWQRRHADQEIARELEAHLALEAKERAEAGLSAREARSAAQRALGNSALIGEETRNVWTWTWLEQVAQDSRYSFRQLRKSWVTSTAAILSLALAIGACTAAFRLVDALLLRALPVAGAERLYTFDRVSIGDDGKPHSGESCSYPLFRSLRAAVKGQAEVIAVSYTSRTDLTYGSSVDFEKAQVQYVSGWMFDSFRLKPAIGRLLAESDDRVPGAHPYAVLSHDYWARRFGKDPKAVGRTFRMGKDLYEIVGVLQQGFTGTEPGTLVDVWVPTMMNARAIDRPYSWWFRAFVQVAPGVSPEVVRSRLEAPFQAFQAERSRTLTGMSPERRQQILSEKITLEPASSGTSNLQRRYRVALTALAVLVALVLLIACANVANLMLARAAARAREMALRVSIGAGRWRLVRLGLIESALVALLSTLLGTFFAYWAAPFVVSRINPPDNPAGLQLPFDWRLWAFSLAIAFAVTVLFGLLPALRASGVKPVAVVKGGEDPHSRGRLMHGLIAAQVAFCVLVLFVSGLFVTSYDRLAKEPTGFAAERLLAVSTLASQPESPVHWGQLAAHLSTVPGVESVAIAGWPLMANQTWDNYVSINGGPPSQVTCKLLHISPGWLQTMKIPLLRGRDLRHDDVFPKVAIVNEAFARTFMGGADPVGKHFAMAGSGQPMQIIGVTRDARYEGPRTPMQPVAYFPFASIDGKGLLDPRSDATLLVRTTSDPPTAVAASLREQAQKARSTFRVHNIQTQQELIDKYTVRERLLAMLALFFAAVALVLAGVGLFGVLDYSVLQRRREIGIRLAIGAPAGAVLRSVTGPAFVMVAIGSAAGLLLGRAAEESIATLLHGVTASDPAALAVPAMVLGAAALLAVLPPALRAIRIDPVQTLRSE